MKKNFTLLVAAFFLSCNAFAQDFNQMVGDHLSKTNTQISEFEIVQNNFSNLTQANQLHVQRLHQGLPVFSTYANYVIKNNRIVWATNSENFDANLDHININPSLSFENALSKFAQSEGKNLITASYNDLNTTQEGVYYFREDQPQLTIFIDDQKEAKLAYNFPVKILANQQNEIFDLIVDAHTGQTLLKHSHTLSCGFDHQSFANENAATFNKADWDWLYDTSDNTLNNGTYRVLQLPLEAPTFGERSLYTGGAFNPTASPFGWHDTDGVAGPEYTVTRGNNTRTVNDHQSIGYSTYNGQNATTTDYIEGGENLTFDFPYDNTRHPYVYGPASASNLFYLTNMMHDIYYRYGFTEQYGNFQQNNYEKGGTANDPVIALSQTGLSIGNSNNATFSTPVDGRHPLMSMYLWSPPASFVGKPFTINSPSNLAGNYEALTGNFGPDLPVDPLTRDLVLVTKSETTGTPFDGCGTITNSAQLQNKIAVVLRGDCTFVQKVQNAQNAGAVGAIIVNNTSGTINMGGDSTTITIPSVSVTQEVGNPIVTALQNNTTVNGTLKYVEIPYIDGSFDNGIIAHEYGHGISNRQTGPASNSSCLSNLEQMGEGWSDFFGLMITQLPTDTSTTRRGIGTFAIGEPTTGAGIRPTVYTTDMAVNPATYARLATYGNSDSPHRTGYVWATMLWDLNWKLIDKYGFSPDLINGTAGNNKTIELVMEGLRVQPCRPGFVDGRNAILQADELLNEGANKCDIWSVFARRGLGYSADQGSSNSRIDGTAAYDMPPADVLNCDLNTSEIASNESFKLFPNPAKDIVNIYDETLKGDVKVEIVDMVGRVVSTETVKMQNNRNTIDTSRLPKGVYVLKFTTEQGVITKKLIKN